MKPATDHDRLDEYAEYFERLVGAFKWSSTKKDVLELAHMAYESMMYQVRRAEGKR